MKKLSIVVPCYNEEENILLFHKETLSAIKNMSINFEMVYIDDGSKDKTLKLLKELALNDSKVNYISFSRNFGKEAGILAGLRYATGDAIILMDGDLQHPPHLIPKMWELYIEGYDQVIAKRNREGESFFRRNTSKLFYKIANHFVEDVEMINGVGDFRLLSRPALDALLQLKEFNRFSKGLFSWIGFSEIIIEYDNEQRVAGTGKWSFKNLLNYAIDGIISFNNRPLRVAIYGGLAITAIGMIYVFIMLINYLINGVQTPGYFTIILAIILMSGLQLIFTGIIGEYIGRIYFETKERPHYIIKEDNIKR